MRHIWKSLIVSVKAGRATILATFRSGSIYIPVLLILGTLFGLRGIQWTQSVTDILASAISMPIAVVFLRKLPKDGLEEGANYEGRKFT